MTALCAAALAAFALATGCGDDDSPEPRPRMQAGAQTPATGVAAQEPAAPAEPAEIIAYHDSGEWDADITEVVRRARRVLRRHLDDRRPAMVLDIDDTSLSSYECLKAVDFDRAAGRCGASGRLPAIRQTRRLYGFARRNRVRVFFITGRREALREITERNLRRAGYRGRLTVKLRPDREKPGTHDGWKARTRRALQRRRDVRIVVNVGDQRSDLRGGAALRRFKLPNPMYVIPTA